MTTLRSIARVAVGRWTRLTAKRGISELRQAGGTEGPRVADALERALAGPGGTASAPWFERIETLRSRLESDPSTLSVTDYGAGSTGDVRTATDMEQGVLVERTVMQTCRASKPAFWASILHQLILEFRPASGIELGTCLGLSAAYQASAMELNGHGRLITLEGADSLAALSTDHLEGLGLGERTAVVAGRFSDTLDSVIGELKPVEYAFIDGHHDERATIEYFEQLLPHLAERAILVFDDTAWTDGMKRAWATIKNHDAVGLSVDLGAVGICVIDPSIAERASIKLSFRGL